jgi:hypothetical protein
MGTPILKGIPLSLLCAITWLFPTNPFVFGSVSMSSFLIQNFELIAVHGIDQERGNDHPVGTARQFQSMYQMITFPP